MYLYPADILLPDFDRCSGKAWAVVACDQYTSEPEYWENVRKQTRGQATALDLMLPEVWLSESDKRVPVIRENMEKYLAEGFLKEYHNCGIYLERTLADGSVRRGIVACVDLEDYDYSPDSVSPIRATEKTVVERIPPRLAVRRGAPLEMPHIMLLADDPADVLLGRFHGRAADAYDFELMDGAGSVKGSFVDASEFTALNEALDAASSGRENAIVFAMGDGNHSLATARAAYEEIKSAIGAEKAAAHPSRFALCEVVNIHDDSLRFEPIFRLVRTEAAEKLTADFKAHAASLCGPGSTQNFEIITASGMENIAAAHPVSKLPVATLQKFLDKWASENPGISETDYIHGEDTLRRLASRPGYVGFLFKGMEKSELFPAVEADGCLPRKTFSMGHAYDKRFYLECRKIK